MAGRRRGVRGRHASRVIRHASGRGARGSKRAWGEAGRRAVKRRKKVAGGVSRRDRWAPPCPQPRSGRKNGRRGLRGRNGHGMRRAPSTKAPGGPAEGSAGRVDCGVRRPDAALDARGACSAAARAVHPAGHGVPLSLREMPKLCRATALQRRCATGLHDRGAAKMADRGGHVQIRGRKSRSGRSLHAKWGTRKVAFCNSRGSRFWIGGLRATGKGVIWHASRASAFAVRRITRHAS